MKQLFNLSPDEVTYERKRDLYRLAEMGDRQSARQWADFAAKNDSLARVIVKDCRIQDANQAVANAGMDGFLIKAEKRLGKKKRRKAARKAGRADIIKGVFPDIQKIYDTARWMHGGAAPDLGDLRVAAFRVRIADEMRADDLASPDPAVRERARGQS